jgi:Flp pilus assembly protein TadG
MKRKHPKAGQAGIAAIEFAFIFPMLFFMLYSIVVYSLLFVVYQSINFAAQEAARAAVALQPGSSSGTYQTTAQDVCQPPTGGTTTNGLSWITSSFGKIKCVASLGGSGTNATLTVTVTFTPASTGLFHAFDFRSFGLGTIPPLPTTLVATAVGQVS